MAPSSLQEPHWQPLSWILVSILARTFASLTLLVAFRLGNKESIPLGTLVTSRQSGQETFRLRTQCSRQRVQKEWKHLRYLALVSLSMQTAQFTSSRSFSETSAIFRTLYTTSSRIWFTWIMCSSVETGVQLFRGRLFNLLFCKMSTHISSLRYNTLCGDPRYLPVAEYKCSIFIIS